MGQKQDYFHWCGYVKYPQILLGIFVSGVAVYSPPPVIIGALNTPLR